MFYRFSQSYLNYEKFFRNSGMKKVGTLSNRTQVALRDIKLACLAKTFTGFHAVYYEVGGYTRWLSTFEPLVKKGRALHVKGKDLSRTSFTVRLWDDARRTASEDDLKAFENVTRLRTFLFSILGTDLPDIESLQYSMWKKLYWPPSGLPTVSLFGARHRAVLVVIITSGQGVVCQDDSPTAKREFVRAGDVLFLDPTRSYRTEAVRSGLSSSTQSALSTPFLSCLSFATSLAQLHRVRSIQGVWLDEQGEHAKWDEVSRGMTGYQIAMALEQQNRPR